MKEIQFKLAIQTYSSFGELPLDEQALLKEAVAALESAYAPYSNFKVGAALLLANGKMVSGGNQENAAFPAGICAEGTAFSVASGWYPGVAVLKVAVTVKSARRVIEVPVAPCGICRQRMLEYENRFSTPIAIIMSGERGEIYKVNSVKDLLPLNFSQSDL
jgi:cytidine deaminase